MPKMFLCNGGHDGVWRWIWGGPSSTTTRSSWWIIWRTACQHRQMETEREDGGKGKKTEWKERESETTRRRLAHGVTAVCLCWHTHLSWRRWKSGKDLQSEAFWTRLPGSVLFFIFFSNNVADHFYNTATNTLCTRKCFISACSQTAPVCILFM